MKEILALRHSKTDLHAGSDLQIICSEAGKPFVYRRGALTIAVNPDSNEKELFLDLSGHSILWQIGTAGCEDGVLKVGGQSFVIFE